MKIVIDHKIPFIRGAFEHLAEVLYLPGGEIRREHLMDADCLLVRTRTRCNQSLLEGTRVRFIGTATIGFDHIDTKWCEENGITWTNAPGCNSGGVAQYVTAALLEMSTRHGFDLKDKTLGIIGVGHVGKKVEKIAHALGMKVLLNDPPRERAEGLSIFTTLPEVLKNADIITIHVPLNPEGTDKTVDLVDRSFLEALKPGAILVNSSRGEILNEQAVLNRMSQARLNPEGLSVNPNLSLVLDVWPHEPEIDRKLLGLADIGTPHIAGYSTDGKYNATKMITESVAREFGITPGNLSGKLEDRKLQMDQTVQHDLQLIDYIRATYDILADDRRLRLSPDTFEEQRNNYPVRREFQACIPDPFPEGQTGRILEGFGFKKIS